MWLRKLKCLLPEDLPAESNLTNSGRLLGIMDDRTKYIYISLEEMNVVADYIKHQRRVSISHLANK
ncbi:hypothetical protein Bca101_020550 [Brassica carinata]